MSRSARAARLVERARRTVGSDPASALELAERALELARREDEPRALGEALTSCGICRLRLGRDEAAEAALREAAESLRERPGRAATLAEAQLARLELRFRAADAPGALRCGLDALRAARSAGDGALEARALNAIGLVQANMGAYAQAVDHLLDSIRTRERHDLPPQGSPLNNLGNIHLLQGDPRAALERFEAALELDTEHPENGARRVVALGNLGRAHEALGDVAEARRWYRRSLDEARALDDAGYLPPALTKLGGLELRSGALAAARTLLDEAAAALERGGAFRTETLRAVAELRAREGAPAEAAELCRDLLTRVEGEPELERDLHLALSRYLADAGAWREALEHHRVYHRLDADRARALYSRRTRAALLEREAELAERERETLKRKNRELSEAYDELRRLHERLERQALELERLTLEDPLTGLGNRRAFDRRLRSEAERARRYGGRFSVLMCDLDDFKAINDRHSHAVGDTILRRVGELLRGSVREVDVVARIGGEEFVVLLPETTAERAAVVAEHLRSTVARHGWDAIAPDLTVTLSIGVTEAGREATDHEILALADERLYRAKRCGKNRIATGAE